MATRTRKAVSKEIVVPEGEGEVQEKVEETKGRKYMSHEHCGHARKGEAGKAARAACRRAHRAWFAAELEWFASDEGAAFLASGVEHPFIKAA